MNFKTKILEIKKIIGMSEQVAESADEAKVKLIDGTEIKYDKLEVGEIVTIVSADGSESPLPANEYELDNGYILVVTDDLGTISKYEIKPEPVEAAEEPATDEAPVDMEARIADLEARVTALESTMSESLSLSASLATANEALTNSTVELSKKLEMSTDAKPIRRTPEVEAIEFEKMTPFQQHRYLKNKEKNNK